MKTIHTFKKKEIGSKLKILSIVLLTFLLLISGCKAEKVIEPVDQNKIKVMTTLFPQYDFAKIVGGDKVDVTLILPPGVEAHSYEPTPQDIISIQTSDLFIYTGEAMEPWVHKMLETSKTDQLVVVDSSKGVQFMEGHHHEEGESEGEEPHEDGDEDHDHDGIDPHIWLDPILAEQMVDNIVEGLSAVDPDNHDYYAENAKLYKEQLKTLDQDFKDTFNKTETKTIVYGGHFAFGYFAKRYRLDHISPFEGFSPNAEPTPGRIAELIDNLNKAKTNYIFYEELVDPKIAKVISEETGAKMLLLHGVHNVSQEERDNGVTYIELMRNNLENLKIGLGYHE